MIWQPILVSVVIAIFVTILLVLPLGWRRPNAVEEEGALLSAAFFFILLFLALWASATWLRPWGPELWGVPWLALLVFACVLALLIGAGMGSSLRPSSAVRYAGQGATSGSTEAVSAAQASREAAEGFGLMFWILVVVLLLAAVVGSV